MVKGLADFLRSRRDRIVRQQAFLEPRWDHTFGAQPPSEVTVELVDFDSLMEQSKEFELSFKEANHG